MSISLLAACGVELDDPGSTAHSAAPLTAAGGIAMKPRALPRKPAAAIQSPRAHDDEIIVKFKEGTRVRLRGGALRFDARALAGNEPALLGRHGLAAAAVARDVAAANAVLASVKIERHFDRPEADLERDKALGESAAAAELADLNLYFAARVDPEAQPALLDQLNALDSVEIAYAPPRPQDAAVDAPPATGSFTASQGYVDAAPVGIDARYARTVQGGAGLGVKVIDVETGWNLNHEDLPAMFATSGQVGSGQHGVSVTGVVAAVENSYGMTGAASDVKFGIASANNTPPNSNTVSYSVARAVDNARASLSAGDIILIEQHAPGPDSNTVCPCNCPQFEFVAMEFFQAEFDAMQSATALGINVVEAAGNGSMDLDSAIYGGNFDRSVRDSGAILVGAGTSFGGRAPECWTNHGSRVDVQGWGDSVATLGGGSLAMVNGNDTNQWYSNTFSGTSSASPIVVSAVADVQGARIAHGLGVASTSAMRSLLVSTGTAQTGTKLIGPLPNLRAALDNLAIKPRVEFVWTAVPASLAFNYTIIDNPATNNKPNAVVQVTHNWGSVVGGIYDDHVLGVWYTGTRWAIFHQDLTAIPANAMFNVVVNDGFVHKATAANTSGHITTINNPHANGNPNAILIVTPNWNPGGTGGTYNNHAIGVWYNGSRWTIYNEDIAAMPTGAAFNVSVSPHGSFVHTATSTTGNASYFANPLAAPLGAHMLITHNFGPFGIYNVKNTGVYYGIGTWAVYLEDRTPMLRNATFNAFAANAARATW